MAPKQARDFVNDSIKPMLEANAAELGADGKGEVKC